MKNILIILTVVLTLNFLGSKAHCQGQYIGAAKGVYAFSVGSMTVAGALVIFLLMQNENVKHKLQKNPSLVSVTGLTHTRFWVSSIKQDMRNGKKDGAENLRRGVIEALLSIRRILLWNYGENTKLADIPGLIELTDRSWDSKLLPNPQDPNGILSDYIGGEDSPNFNNLADLAFRILQICAAGETACTTQVNPFVGSGKEQPTDD